jgi:hypothetical protein
MIDKQTLDSIQQKVWTLGRAIGAPINLLIVRWQASGYGEPYIDLDNDGFHYIISERGMEMSRRTVVSLDELLYLLLEDAVSAMAWDYEREHRVKGRDPRRIAFPERIRLMSQLDPRWAARAREDIDETLKSSPYFDDP